MNNKIAILLLVCLSLIAVSTTVLADTDISDGNFTYDNVRVIYSNGDEIKILGEMTNNSGKDYDLIQFTITLYDFSDEILEAEEFFISNLNNEETKTFKKTIYKDYSTYHHDFKIQFDDGIVKK
ncbi:MAG: hypothetical protein AWU54_290 [Candidatus Frackibacter sp. T328-2]|nr:MAG: hypothetical protein AWU54_290 [Candidatus Frackibacter sp. T328-2]